MIKRPTAIYNGQIIGIETIYTVQAGKRINIPGEIERIRALGRNRELFCPCGCGLNLILVAGENNIREQHFRAARGSVSEKECTYSSETIESLSDKVVLKCWLEDKLENPEIEARVRTFAVSDTPRRYEFAFLSRKYGLAIDYCHIGANMSDEKIEVIESVPGIKLIHILSYRNERASEQYPEYKNKIQKVQKYCLFISSEDGNYETALMSAAFYTKEASGFWKMIPIGEGLLSEYSFDTEKGLLLRNVSVESLYKEKLLEIEEQHRRESEQKTREAATRAAYLEAERKKREEQERERLRLKAEKEAAEEADFQRYLEEMKEYREKKKQEQLLWDQERKNKENAQPYCSECGAIMVKRIRRSDGKPFWGCSRYPQCNGTKTYRR